MNVNVVSTSLIKPFTPTPPNLNKHKLSFLDELVPPSNVGFVLLYLRSSNPKPISHVLEETLAKILPQFYPLAGRYIKEDHLVDCSDQGAELVRAEAVQVELADLVEKMEQEKLNDLLPAKFYQVDESPTDPLLSIQITEFKCGGLAVGFSVYHRVFDACSVGTFIDAWSNANNPGPGRKIPISPSFEAPSLFPSTNQLGGSSGILIVVDPEIAIKRYSFNKEAIARLRSKLRPNCTFSRVRVVCAVIAKALIGVDVAKHGKSRASVIFQAINLRERTTPSLPKHSCGNVAIASLTRRMDATESNNIGIQELVDILGDGIKKTIDDCAEMLSPGVDTHSIIMDPLVNLTESIKSDVNVMMFSDWSKFGLSEADLGWGKPVGVGIGAAHIKNMVVLLYDKEGDGMEAWVHLNRNHMHYFEQDENIKLFAKQEAYN